MPSLLDPSRPGRDVITRLTNCRLVVGDKLIWGDLWASSSTGTILSSQATFFDTLTLPDRVVDLQGRIVSPGLIDVQLNGAFGFNFSTLPEPLARYPKDLAEVNRQLITTGVTSYLPTLTSQRPDLYHKVLSFLGPKETRIARDGSESLGAHVEGPFLNPSKNGIHDVSALREASTFADIESCYGADNLDQSGAIRKITLAPERGDMLSLIPELTSRGIVVSLGHTEATYEEASQAVAAGATMITHLFNAMRPLHHRNPGPFGLLGDAETANSTSSPPRRPYFGVIADGVHLHPTAVKIASNAHPEGFILVTDSMHLVGLPDGAYPWTDTDASSRIIKKGSVLSLEGTHKIAGSAVTLVECVNKFLRWSGATVPQALGAVTATPARMLGVQGRKGCLDAGADADLVVFSETVVEDGAVQLMLDEVWKFGTRVFERDSADSAEPSVS